MIMKLSNHAKFFCPESASREKLFSCKGEVCPSFNSLWFHRKVVEGREVFELMFYCGKASAPGPHDEELQYPQHEKEIAEWRKFIRYRAKEERRMKEEMAMYGQCTI